jgi:hypothetical protein
MARNITLTLGAGLGADLGPNFNLTANVGSVTPSTATKSELTAGKSVSVDDSATQVTVTSTGTCTNAITQTIPCAGETTTTTTTAPTTTTTTAPTTTTTTSAPVGCTTYDVIIEQADLDDADGNTDPGKNDFTLYLDYIDCGGNPVTSQYGFASTYSICTQEFAITPVLYYFKNNLESVPFGGSITLDTFVPCV